MYLDDFVEGGKVENPEKNPGIQTENTVANLSPPTNPGLNPGRSCGRHK